MEGLRGILAVAGVLVVGFVYWWSKREQHKRTTEAQERIEPSWGDTNEDAAIEEVVNLVAEPPPPADEIEPVGEQPDIEPEQAALDIEPPESPPEKIVAMRIVARETEQFPGEDLILTMRGLGLRHGKFGIFHRHEGEDDAVVFSVANLLEPGSFDLANIKDQAFPGVSLFMVLPGPTPGPIAFDGMVETARSLAKALGGEVLDANGSSFSIQRERFIREEIIQYEHGVSFG